MFETRRLLKESKYKRIIIDDSDKMMIEPYDGETLSIYCDNRNNDDDKMSTQSYFDNHKSDDDKMSTQSYTDQIIDDDKEEEVNELIIEDAEDEDDDKDKINVEGDKDDDDDDDDDENEKDEE